MDEIAAPVHEQDQQLAAEFNEPSAEAPDGWLPSVENRHGASELAFERCLGITSGHIRRLDGGQHLALAGWWFSGEDSLIDLL